MPILTRSLRTLLPLILLAAVATAQAQDAPWYDSDPLPQAMTAEEMTRLDEIGLGFAPTPPPSGPVRVIAEFERNEGVLVRYPLGIPLALVAAMSEHVRVVTLVANAAQEAQASSAYQNAGVTMANAEFLQAPTNSIWTRDYGPFYVADENRQISIVDFVYNRPRPYDDAVPVALGANLDVPVYAMNVVHTGGNYMADSRGIAASTDLIWEENGFNEEYVMDQMRDYLGVDTYHVTQDPQDTYLKHIDTWAKFLDVDKILIAEVPASNPHYAEHEAVAAYFASQPSAYGTPYQVFRVYTPGGEPYTNSLILNERIYVPIENSPWDDEALDAYRAAMPGYEVLGFTGSWLSTDALHCRTKEIADRQMIYLHHQPLAGEVPYQPTFDLDVDIIAHSGEALRTEDLHLIYRIDDAPFDTLALQPVGGDTFTAALPIPQGEVEVAYYFSAADASGRTERFPLIGPEGARTFTVLGQPVANEATPDDLGFRFDAVYPNPAAGAVSVRYTVETPGPVTVEVLDLLGRRLAVLHDGPAIAGAQRVMWTPDGVAAGVYLVRLRGAGGQAVRRLVLTR